MPKSGKKGNKSSVQPPMFQPSASNQSDCTEGHEGHAIATKPLMLALSKPITLAANSKAAKYDSATALRAPIKKFNSLLSVLYGSREYIDDQEPTLTKIVNDSASLTQPIHELAKRAYTEGRAHLNLLERREAQTLVRGYMDQCDASIGLLRLVEPNPTDELHDVARRLISKGGDIATEFATALGIPEDDAFVPENPEIEQAMADLLRGTADVDTYDNLKYNLAEGFRCLDANEKKQLSAVLEHIEKLCVISQNK